MSLDLVVSPERHKTFEETGIFVRAQLDGKWGSYDISHLDGPSLLRWLRSRGGHNPWAESTVGLLLGHEDLLNGDTSPVSSTPAINALIQACNHQELGELILPRRAGPWYSEWVLWNSGGLNRTGWRFGRKAYDYSERDYTGDPICAVTEEADGRFSVQVLGEHIGAWPSAQEARDSADKKLAEEHVVLSER